MEGLPPTNISSIKNKQRRSEAYKKLKQEKRKAKQEERKNREEQRKLLGEDAVPRQTPKTIENTRVYDETMVDPEDEEVMLDEEADEFSSYFRRETTPKILITTTDRPNARTNKFCKELKKSVPNSYIYYRRGLALKKIIPQAVSKDFTDIIIVNEDHKQPNGLILCHLPDGPTAHFRLSSLRLCKEIKRSGALSDHKPELILNNFGTRMGHTVGRMLAALYPHEPQFTGRRVAVWHNQRDYIFFRQYRYQFRSEKKVSKQELGPRFTLRLRSIQRGTFDSLHGEYEFIDQPREMAKSRRKFVL